MGGSQEWEWRKGPLSHVTLWGEPKSAKSSCFYSGNYFHKKIVGGEVLAVRKARVQPM